MPNDWSENLFFLENLRQGSKSEEAAPANDINKRVRLVDKRFFNKKRGNFCVFFFFLLDHYNLALKIWFYLVLPIGQTRSDRFLVFRRLI
jgi:hypothetical protein